MDCYCLLPALPCGSSADHPPSTFNAQKNAATMYHPAQVSRLCHGVQASIAPLIVMALMSVSVLAQDQLSNAKLARASSDPTSSLWYFFSQLSELRTPSLNSSLSTLELQPTMPVPLTSSIRFLNYPDLVLASQNLPHVCPANGVQSFSYLGALSPVHHGYGFSWGLGPYISFPVSTSQELAPIQWQAGPGGVATWTSKNDIASALIKSGWSTSGTSQQAGMIQLQYSIQHFFGDGYQVGLGRPRIEYNWSRNGRGVWNVPVGFDIAKMVRFGRLPVKIMLEYDYTMLDESQWRPQSLFRIMIEPILPVKFTHSLL
jgi:hypothetical protein